MTQSIQIGHLVAFLEGLAVFFVGHGKAEIKQVVRKLQALPPIESGLSMKSK
jgi:hypothetical protein